MLAEWQVGQVLWSILWITLVFMWIMLVIRVFSDVFRSRDLGGFAKVLWILFVIVMPYLGVFCYLIARGRGMAERDAELARAQEAAVRGYIRDAAGTSPSPADELERLAALRQQGTIDDDEFARAKARIIG